MGGVAAKCSNQTDLRLTLTDRYASGSHRGDRRARRQGHWVCKLIVQACESHVIACASSRITDDGRGVLNDGKIPNLCV